MGHIHFNYINERHGTFSIGMVNIRNQRGKGYGEPALRLLLDYAFNELGFDKVGNADWPLLGQTHRVIGSCSTNNEWEARPNPQQTEELAQMFYEAYGGADAIGYPGTNTVESQREALTFYFAHNDFELLNQASGVIYDRSTENTGRGLLNLNTGVSSFVSNIAVLHSHRGNELATGLLSHAPTVLHSNYDVIRLFVTVGNGAEALYYNLGFHPGPAQTTFYLP